VSFVARNRHIWSSPGFLKNDQYFIKLRSSVSSRAFGRATMAMVDRFISPIYTAFNGFILHVTTSKTFLQMFHKCFILHVTTSYLQLVFNMLKHLQKCLTNLLQHFCACPPAYRPSCSLGFSFFFSRPNFQGHLADQQTLSHVRWWPIFIKFGQKFGAPSPEIWWPINITILTRFWKTSRLDCKYLRNATRHRQSENGVANYRN